MARVRTRRQMAFEEKVIQDPELEQILEDREKVIKPHVVYVEKTKLARTKVKDLGVEGPFRVGRFMVNVKPKESKHVEFDQQATLDIGFSLAEDKE